MIVSVVIATHNRLETLKEAIESVLGQTFEDFECIVVDDCSSDGTQSYLEDFAKNNRKIKYIRLDNKLGMGGNYARNIGIKESKGKYVAFLDDDDVWMRSKLKKQVKVLDAYPEVGMVICGRRIEYNDGVYFKNDLPGRSGVFDCAKEIFYRYIGVTSALMCRKEALLKVGLFDETLKFWQDYELEIRMCQLAKVYFINEPLICYRENFLDKHRKTNKLDGWLESVDQVQMKHSKIIRTLSAQDKKNMWALIYNDAATRCSYAGDKKRQRVFLKKALSAKPTIKQLIKYIAAPDTQKHLVRQSKRIRD